MLAWRCLGRCLRARQLCTSATPCSLAGVAAAAAADAPPAAPHPHLTGLSRLHHASRRPAFALSHGLASYAAQSAALGQQEFARRSFSTATRGAPVAAVDGTGDSLAASNGSGSIGDVLPESSITTKAYHIGTELDIIEVAKEHPRGSHRLESDHCILWVPELKDSTDIFQPGEQTVTLPRRCLVLFPFGSVVFFGFGDDERKLWLQALRRHTTGPLDHDQYRSDDLKLDIRPQQTEWIRKGQDVIHLKCLNVATTRILALVLAQSVALDTYMSKVDQALARTVVILEGLTKASANQSMKSQGLMNLLCQNNLLYTTVITKLGVLDYSPLAWRQDRYYDVWKLLQEEYEMTRRVNALERKLGPIQENVKFLLQLEHTKKSERSEVIIIYLIAIEIILTCVHIFYENHFP